MSKGLHPKSGSKFEQNIEQGSNAFGSFCCFVLAGIVVLFICSDASIQTTHAIHHDEPVDVLAYLGLK